MGGWDRQGVVNLHQDMGGGQGVGITLYLFFYLCFCLLLSHVLFVTEAL